MMGPITAFLLLRGFFREDDARVPPFLVGEVLAWFGFALLIAWYFV